MIKVCKHLLNNLHYCLKVWSRTDFVYVLKGVSYAQQRCLFDQKYIQNCNFLKYGSFYSMLFHTLFQVLKSLGSVIFLKEVSYTDQGCIYLITNAVQ